MKLGFIYAGQGSQYVGMGQSFYENNEECKDFLDHINIDFDLKEMMFNGNEELNKTEFTQPAMVAVAAMATLMLRRKNITPSYVCGLSLGEYSALAASGAISFNEAISLVRIRGLAMSEAVKGIQSKMYAVIGLEREKLQQAIDKASSLGVVTICNYNCPGQLVISGEEEATTKASELALELGARKCIPLNTSGPFHTSLMSPAARTLHTYFPQISFRPMRIPVIFNTTARELEANTTISEMEEKQVMSPVYFEDSIRYMIDKGVDTIIEIGPGKVLSGFVRKIDRSIKCFQVEDMESLEKTLKQLEVA